MRHQPKNPIVGDEIDAVFAENLIGQPHVAGLIRPFVDVFQAHASLEGHPVGTLVLLGPTGVGKTHSVELLARALHGNDRHYLRVDCGEFQMDHEVAKLIGAPPGYLGHRETQPMLNQAKLNSFTSERCSMSIVLFDEIEKAAPSMQRLLLGVMDKGTLRLGDNTSVNFERTIIFMTSNLGSREILRAAGDGLGFRGLPPGETSAEELERVSAKALSKHFTPEFLNRIDARIPFRLLSEEDLKAIARLHFEQLSRHLSARWGLKFAGLKVTSSVIADLAKYGGPAWGARELKRRLHRHVTVPLAQMFQRDNAAFAAGPITLSGTLEKLKIAPTARTSRAAAMANAANPLFTPTPTQKKSFLGLELDPDEVDNA